MVLKRSKKSLPKITSCRRFSITRALWLKVWCPTIIGSPLTVLTDRVEVGWGGCLTGAGRRCQRAKLIAVIAEPEC